nr:ABC transporter permease subunit [Kribbella solani]
MLKAEWTKLRSVPGWVRGLAVATLMILLFPVAGLASGAADRPAPPQSGPNNQPVSAAFYFVHRQLAGDGQLTVAVNQLDADAPWAKAGLILTVGREPGARYAAIMVTRKHGVRMQYDYTHDRAAQSAVSSARWLRLTRTGDTVTGEASTDGMSWSRVDSVRLPGLAATVQAGLFVASPQLVNGLGTAGSAATAEFGTPRVSGDWSAAEWRGEQVGAKTSSFAGYPPGASGGFTSSGSGFTVTGAGDLAPATRADIPVAAAAGDLLLGTFPALIVIVVIATLAITTEYRYGLIRTTLSVGASRLRTLAAKAAVLAGATFVAALVGLAIGLPVWLRLVRKFGLYVFPATPGDQLRLVVGTAAVLALIAVFALGVGTILRRSATAVTTVVVVTVLPYLLAMTPFLPASIALWLTRFTPAAAFAVQQTLTRYPQVDAVYTPANGYYPLSAWAGLAVLCAYTAVTLLVAAVLLNRRDA